MSNTHARSFTKALSPVNLFIPCALVVMIIACNKSGDVRVPVKAAPNSTSAAANADAAQLNQTNPESNGAAKAGPDDVVTSATNKINTDLKGDVATKAKYVAAAQEFSQIETSTDSKTATPTVTLTGIRNQQALPVLTGALAQLAADPTFLSNATDATVQANYYCEDNKSSSASNSAFSSDVADTMTTDLDSGAGDSAATTATVAPAAITTVTPAAALAATGVTTPSVIDCETAKVHFTLTPTPNQPSLKATAIVRHTRMDVALVEDQAPTNPSPAYVNLKAMLTRPPEDDATTTTGSPFGFMDSSEMVFGSTFVRINFVLVNDQGQFESVGLVSQGVNVMPIKNAPNGIVSGLLTGESTDDLLNTRWVPTAPKKFQHNVQMQIFSLAKPVITSIHGGTKYKISIRTAVRADGTHEHMTLMLTRRFEHAPKKRGRVLPVPTHPGQNGRRRLDDQMQPLPGVLGNNNSQIQAQPQAQQQQNSF
jgi:hypothetical protein